MKLSFWDILASMIMLAGLAMATIFINIFANPYSFINPFPPPTPISTLDVPTLTPSLRSLPDLWTATPETPGVPSVTPDKQTSTATITGTFLVLPTGTSTSTATITQTFTKTPSLTPNLALTYSSLLTATSTKTPGSGSDDTTPPTNPGTPYTNSTSSDSTPDWRWTASSDDDSGIAKYQITWGTNNSCENSVYTSNSNSWTAPAMALNTRKYICVRAKDDAGNESAWVGPRSFSYLGSGAPSVSTTSAINVTSTSATLRGIVSSNGSATTVYFIWGVGAAVGNSVDAAESPLASTASSVTVNGNISGLTAGTTYYYRIHASNTDGTASGTELSFTTSRLNQTALTVNDPGTVTFGTSPTLTTSGGSGTGAVTFSASGTGCSVGTSTGVLTITNASGTCSITATKAGDTTYNPTTSAARSITMAKASQTITATVDTDPVVYGTTATLGSSGSSGTGAVTYSSGASTGCSASGTTLSVTNATGTCTVTATIATDNNYTAATSGTLTVGLSKADPTITFGSAPSATFGDADFSVSATTDNTDDVTLTYSRVSGPCALDSGSTFTISGAGTCVVQADGAATPNFNAATETQDVTIDPASTTTSIDQGSPNPTNSGDSYTVTVTVTSSAGTPTGDVSVSDGESGSCTVTLSGGTGTCSLTSTGTGLKTLTADYGGDANFDVSSDTNTHTVS